MPVSLRARTSSGDWGACGMRSQRELAQGTWTHHPSEPRSPLAADGARLAGVPRGSWDTCGPVTGVILA